MSDESWKNDYIVVKAINTEDDQFVAVGRRIFGAKIVVCTPNEVLASYCYQTVGGALSAFADWDGKTGEPEGWIRALRRGDSGAFEVARAGGENPGG